VHNIIEHLIANIHHVVIFIILVLLFKKLVNTMMKQDIGRNDNVFDAIMTEDEKNLHIYTQLNTKLNGENLDNAYVLSNKYHQEVFGKKSSTANISPKKAISPKKRVKFSDKNIIFD